MLYDIDGDVPDEEVELDHLARLPRTRSRSGSATPPSGQLQLDIYGELIDSVYLFNKYGPGISYDAWRDLTRLVDWLMDNWDRPDAGMWEARDEPQTHTTSRLMGWVAIERMIRVARQRGLPGDLAALVAGARRDLRPASWSSCWDAERRAFMQHEGADTGRRRRAADAAW